jgi:TPR repeat protein
MKRHLSAPVARRRQVATIAGMLGTRARILSLALLALLLSAVVARAQSGLGPADAQDTLSGTLRYRCALQALCPLSSLNYDMLKRAAAGEREAQFYVGLNLYNGDDAPLDRKAGLAWMVRSAESGMPVAAEWVEHRMQNGEDIEIDETKVATALKVQVDKGDPAAMLVLARMTIRGRGVAQDPQAGIALMLKAAEHSRGGETEYQIAQLYLTGANGLTRDHEEAMKWYARAAGRGHVFSMATLGGLWENVPLNDLVDAMRAGQFPIRKFEPDIVQSYCWRVRAAQMGSTLAQYELALMLTRRSSDSRGNVIEPDLVQADFWFRLGARSPDYNNSQVRGAIEPKLTTAQLDQAKKLVAGWRQLDFDQ